jgi:hypothetical protein
MSTLTILTRATHDAYHALYNGADTTTTYATLEAIYAAHGLDADIAESSVDWYESRPLLIESLTEALDAVGP